ncbi:hypothetical protein [Calothrix sp. PCC 7507]|uniref:hypothetical protein n=1 Tax=Calothrix sp. PCC 7507 TaxID=99598 RepID=UPI00029ECA66|nr:hypothetical protein [Calothrix sp. PCC 7507]AFY35922.1 hypothetical protein Cal7507_5596 [Calothrix sp. PCC 7507]
MLQSKKKVCRNRSSAHKMLNTKAIRLTAPILAIAGWLATIAPGMALTASYSNDYRACAGQLLKVNINAVSALPACAKALHPRELSTCVVKISKETQINAVDALTSCRQVRLPEELATCVVGISQNTKGVVNPAVLNYCGRSLLPVRFAQCVVGLRSEVKELDPTQALDTCIDASDRVSGFAFGSTPPTKSTTFSPTFETTPIPVTPGSK